MAEITRRISVFLATFLVDNCVDNPVDRWGKLHFPVDKSGKSPPPPPLFLHPTLTHSTDLSTYPHPINTACYLHLADLFATLAMHTKFFCAPCGSASLKWEKPSGKSGRGVFFAHFYYRTFVL